MKNPIGGKFRDEESVSRFNEEKTLEKKRYNFHGNLKNAQKKYRWKKNSNLKLNKKKTIIFLF
jgi:hypothetical protein